MQEQIRDSKGKPFEWIIDKYVTGMIVCDGIAESQGIKDSFCLIWFLNLALPYRDMISEDTYKNFFLDNHTPQSYWLMGCC